MVIKDPLKPPWIVHKLTGVPMTFIRPDTSTNSEALSDALAEFKREAQSDRQEAPPFSRRD
jgi:hypothetical protein